MDGTLIFLDIDGTLVVPGRNEPSASTLEAVRGAQAAGHRVFLCTGRNRRMLGPLLAYGFDGYIASSGGYVVCGNEVLFDRPMTDTQLTKALSALACAGIARIAEGRDAAFADERYLDYLKDKLPGSASSETARWQAQLERNMGLYPRAAYRGEALYKIVLLGDSQRTLEAAHAALEEEFALVIQGADLAGTVNAELLPRSFDKGRGVRIICARMGVPPECCFGYGDSMNDRELLETVGHGVAMGNACVGLKGIADEICLPVDEEGLLVSFRQNGLL